jgi:death-on-curing protein
MLESALARPVNQWGYGEDDRHALAAAYAFGIARNHPFVDGNKRTAHVCYRAFLAMNDVELLASDEEKYLRMLSLAEGSLDEAGFAAWLRPLLKLDAGMSVNEPRARYAR